MTHASPTRGQTDQGERGATAILVAMAMLLIMGFAAIAVDSGILFSDRRQQQSAADSGALAALQFARTGAPASSIGCSGSGATYAACRGAEEAIAVVEGTLPGRYPLAAWQACTDSGALAVTSLTTGGCVSFSTNFQRSRVVLPGTDVATTFGRVIGPDSKRVTAGAEAELDVERSADILPFAIGPSGANQSQSCLFAQATAQLDITPCEASDSGNFGKLDLSLYGNILLGTVQNCGNTDPQGKMAVNIAIGSDHILETAPSSPGTVNEVTNCPIISNPVDQIPVQTGNASQGISNGLFYGIATPSYEGRLMCKTGGAAGELPGKVSAGSPPCVNAWSAFPQNIDHTPLWRFIDPGANAEASGACPSGGVNNRLQMEDCLTAWRDYAKNIGPHTIPLFTDNLRTATRFAAVPILASDPSGGSGNYSIIDFRPVYIETIYMKCNANTCDTVHSPGEDGSAACPPAVLPTTSACGYGGNGNANSIEALTGFVMTMDMLPDSIAENFPGELGTVVYNLSR